MIDVIFCAGGNRRFAQIALEEGMLYGLRGDYTAYWPPVMVDIPFKQFWQTDAHGIPQREPRWSLWKTQLAKIARWQPRTALVPDYLSPGYRRALVKMACQLVEAGVDRPMMCPKFPGAVEDIPEWCVVAVSVPSSYEGYLPPLDELRGRRVHLLGAASPKDQLDLLRYYAMYGIEVVSVDVNAHQKAAQNGTYYSGGKWRNRGRHVVPTDEAFRASCRAIMRQFKEVA